MTEYRTGAHWGFTIVRNGPGPEDVMGHHSGDELVAVVVNGDRDLAERICALLNADDGPRTEPDPHDVIAAVAHRAASASSELGALLYANCPGPHRLVPHPDMSARWCQACGYAERGRRMEERP